jgi:hypothetical protein
MAFCTKECPQSPLSQGVTIAPDAEIKKKKKKIKSKLVLAADAAALCWPKKSANQS